MKRLLVTGASGFLGWYICQHAHQQGWQVFGTYHRHAIAMSNVSLLHVELTDFLATKELIHTLRPDAVIHAAAQSSPNQCQQDPDTAHSINVIAAWTIAELCADAAIPCAFTSSEMVFDGLHAPYTEADPVCPINRYGEQKVLAETGMVDRYPQVTICRMPLMYGAAPTASSFIQPFLQTLQEGRSLNLFVDEIRTPVSGSSAAVGILLALEKAKGQIIHLGGKERLSRYEFGSLLVDVLQLPNANLTACHQADVSMAAPRPPDLSLDSSYAFSLGYQPGRVRDELQRLAIALR